MSGQLRIPGEALPYLIAQRGAIDDMRGDNDTWLEAYGETIMSEFQSIEGYLPKQCEALLDVGSGMGGIDILISRHYDNQLEVTLLDGVDDTPDVSAHAKTFNDMRIAMHFLKLNGVARANWIDANGANRRASRYYDLVVSFHSWCFHLEPAVQLSLVAEATQPGAVLILDVRRGKPEWRQALERYFRLDRVIYTATKFETLRYVRT
jgi:SAM-dependent methyltransferase